MLYLSRDINETVIVGDNIQVKIMAVEGTKVLLGFLAPREVSVHREEIYKQIQNKRRDLFFTTGGK